MSASRPPQVGDPEFLDLLAHELRGPLFPIIALSDLLLTSEGGPPEDWRAHLERIAASGQELLALLTDLLDLGRIDVARVGPAPGPVELDTLTDDLRAAHAGAPRPVGVVGPGAVVCFADRRGLERIAGALIDHALDDDEDGPVELELALGPDELALSVGVPPMRPEDRATAFLPFWRRSDRGTPRSRGLGLRLPIAERWARLLGGRAEVVADGARDRVRIVVPAAEPRRPSRGPGLVLLASPQPAAVYAVTISTLALGLQPVCVPDLEGLAQVSEGLEPRLRLIDPSLDPTAPPLPHDVASLDALLGPPE
jgi:signal transduction histidine kinase